MKVHTAKSGLSLKLSDRWSDPIKIVEVVNNTVGVKKSTHFLIRLDELISNIYEYQLVEMSPSKVMGVQISPRQASPAGG